MNNLALSLDVRNDRSTVIKTRLDAGSTGGRIRFYSLPLPATTGAAITTQTLIATCDLSRPCGTVANGALTLATISPDLAADNSGAIAFGRIIDSDEVFVGDGTAGVTGSGAIFIFDTLTAIAGGAVSITSIVIHEGNA